MALTPLRILELNKRVDKILHAPANAPAGGQQLEIAFVLDLSADRAYLDEMLRDTVRALKAHDKIFQNVRSNVVYCSGERITTKVTPMSFIQMGKAMEDIDVEQIESAPDSGLDLGALCAYLKLYHARSKCIFVLTSGTDFMDSEGAMNTAAYGDAACNRDAVIRGDVPIHVEQPAENDGIRKAIEGLNPFLKYRMLILTPDKMVSGTELLLKLMAGGEGSCTADKGRL